MTTVISVRFRSGCKTYFFDPGDVQVQTGDHVIVETAQGLEYAQCTMGNHPVDDCCVIQPLRPMVRVEIIHLAGEGTITPEISQRHQRSGRYRQVEQQYHQLIWLQKVG